MKCAFCGYTYEQEEAAQVCQGCTLFGGCHLTKCPRCGYEQPQEPPLVQWLRRWRARRAIQAQTLERK